MAKWFLEPGHTAAEFCVRHMMVTFVRGHFKDIHGTLVFDPADPGATSVEATIEASGLWTGEADRNTSRAQTFSTWRTIRRSLSQGSRSNWPARTKRFSRAR
jgi:polyisoprenoid-binding protein YceI